MAEPLELGKRRAKELGLKLWENTAGLPLYYHSQDIHKLLGEGVDFSALRMTDSGLGWHESNINEGKDAYQALLIGIRPIVQESEERKLLRGLVNNYYDERGVGCSHELELMSKAKRLLEGEK